MPVPQVKAKLDGRSKQKHFVHSRQQDAVVSIRAPPIIWAVFVRRCSIKQGITSQQYNVLRILTRRRSGGLPTLDIAERMIEQAPV